MLKIKLELFNITVVFVVALTIFTVCIIGCRCRCRDHHHYANANGINQLTCVRIVISIVVNVCSAGEGDRDPPFQMSSTISATLFLASWTNDYFISLLTSASPLQSFTNMKMIIPVKSSASD